jgi:hypothetical protein
MSYGMTVDLLKEVLPISEDISKTAIHQNVAYLAQRQEDELGKEKFMYVEGCQRDWEKLPDPSGSTQQDQSAENPVLQQMPNQRRSASCPAERQRKKSSDK